MKYNVKIGEKSYTVEIEDINARPVVAHVDGERVEVMPENALADAAGQQVSVIKERREKEPLAEVKSYLPNLSAGASPSPNPALSGNTIAAPLPGTVIEIFVKAGDKVEAGQIVLVIEAMKMKNSIRSTWSGTIGEVFVSSGQAVAHKQPLVKFADLGEASWM